MNNKDRKPGYYWVSRCTTPDKREVGYYYGETHARPWMLYSTSGDWLEKDLRNVNEKQITEDADNG